MEECKYELKLVFIYLLGFRLPITHAVQQLGEHHRNPARHGCTCSGHQRHRVCTGGVCQGLPQLHPVRLGVRGVSHQDQIATCTSMSHPAFPSDGSTTRSFDTERVSANLKLGKSLLNVNSSLLRFRKSLLT